MTGSCFLGDHISGDHIHTDVTTGNTEVAQQMYSFGMASNDYWGGGGLTNVLLGPNPQTSRLQWFLTFCLHADFLTHQ